MAVFSLTHMVAPGLFAPALALSKNSFVRLVVHLETETVP